MRSKRGPDTVNTQIAEPMTAEAISLTTCVKQPRHHIPLAERLKDWDGQPYELAAEDGEWANMEPAGEEI